MLVSFNRAFKWYMTLVNQTILLDSRSYKNCVAVNRPKFSKLSNMHETYIVGKRFSSAFQWYIYLRCYMFWAYWKLTIKWFPPFWIVCIQLLYLKSLAAYWIKVLILFLFIRAFQKGPICVGTTLPQDFENGICTRKIPIFF